MSIKQKQKKMNTISKTIEDLNNRLPQLISDLERNKKLFEKIEMDWLKKEIIEIEEKINKITTAILALEQL